MTFLGCSGLINFIICLSLGLFVLFKNPRNIVNRVYFYGNFSICIYSFGYFFWQLSKTQIEALFWFEILTTGIILINVTYLHFVFAFVGILKEKRKLLNILYVINLIFIFLNLKSSLYTSLEPRYNLGFWPRPTVFFHIYLAFWFWQCLYGFLILLNEIKITSGVRCHQIKYFALAAAIGFIGGATNWPMWYKIYLPPYLNLSISIYAIVIAYTILKYRLMDINVALTRAGVFIAVYLLVLGIPFWVGFKYLGKGPWILPVSIMSLFASVGPFIYIFLQRRAEEALLKERRRYQETINNLSESMIDIRDIEKLFTTISSTITEAIKIKFAVIYLKQEEYKAFQLKSCYPKEAKSQFEEFIPLDDSLIGILNQRKKPLLGEEVGQQGKISLDSGVAIPFFGKDGLIGFIVLGAKQNNQMYTNDDLLVLETFSYNAGSAIENCTYWKEIEEHQRRARIAEMDLFSYSIAHEIDNPLTAIKTAVRFLRDFFLKELNLPPEKRKEAEDVLNSILKNQERISTMIKAVEEFGKPVLAEFGPLRLEDVLKSYLELYLPQFKHQGISFTQEMPDKEIPYLRGLKQELMQVLVNLSNNSIHALLGVPQGEQKRIHLKVEILDSDFVRIIFKDNGYGIVKEKLSSIFGAFTTTKASTEGKGMGLYACRRIIERHKGKLWAESEGKGKGATFIIELPIAKDITEEDFKKEDRGRMMF